MDQPSLDLNDLPSILVGVSGEYFVAAELSRRGYIASITLRNTRGIDILAANADATRSVSIQVKTNRQKKKEWMLSQKAEGYQSKSLFYVFVNLNGSNQRPDYHVVPSKDVARFVTRDYQEWSEKKPRGDTNIRQFKDPESKYRDCWDLLGL
ncbi:MAG: hypothetical protein SGJ16_08000 [Nitrospirota bacterium]|nr:hypothetical protein [Nitrospirota bacterium]